MAFIRFRVFSFDFCCQVVNMGRFPVDYRSTHRRGAANLIGLWNRDRSILCDLSKDFPVNEGDDGVFRFAEPRRVFGNNIEHRLKNQSAEKAATH